MFATAPATARPARSSRGREMMRTTRPPVVDGLSLALQAASSDTSTSTTARIQASYAIVTDFFNGLLGRLRVLVRFCARTPGEFGAGVGRQPQEHQARRGGERPDHEEGRRKIRRVHRR